MQNQKKSIDQLKSQAHESRKLILKMIHAAGSGHPGGSLSAIDIITALFFHEMRHDPKKPRWEDRDRFVLSKGHGVPALYATLAAGGYISSDEAMTLRQLGSRMQGHPDRVKFDAIEASTGSLGQGLSIAQGLAMGLKLDKKDARVYCMLGDGEIQEGQIWEAALSITKYNLTNLVTILDYNRFQIDGSVKDVMNLEPLAEKWKSFGFHVLEIDGHDMNAILGALDKARRETSKPTFIIAHTVKGKGVSFMENHNEWHGSAPSSEQLEKALKELN